MIRTCMGVGCNYYEFELLLLEAETRLGVMVRSAAQHAPFVVTGRAG